MTFIHRLRTTLSVALMAPITALLLPQAAQAQQAQFLVHEASGLCVDVSGAPGTKNGAPLLLWQCETQGNRDNGSATDHKWYFQNGFIRNGLSGKCFDIPGAPGTKEGSRLQLWDCELSGRLANGSQTDQQFDVVSDQFRHRLSGLCVGPVSTNNYRNGVALALVKCAKPGAADLEFRLRQPGTAPVVAAAPKPAPAPANAKARMIYPDYPGANQTCVMPVDPQSRKRSVVVGAELALGACNPKDTHFVVSANRITLAGRPDLCVNIGAGARSASPYVEACKDTAVAAWDIAGTSTQSARIRANGGVWNNQCWAIPDLANNKATLPMRIHAVDCRQGKDLAFFVE